MNHYPRHVGDITLATFGLSFSEFGCYDRLLDSYYANESPLPLDQRERYRLVGAISKSDRVVVDYIVGRYFIKDDDGWHNKRADEEIANYRERIEGATRASKAGVAARSHVRQPNGISNGKPNGRPSDPPNGIPHGKPNGDLTRTIDHKPEPEPEPKASDVERPTPKAKNKGAAAPLPDWLPQQAWQDFVDMRNRIRKPLTEKAIELGIAELDELRLQGHDPVSLINKAVLKNWLSFYPPKENERRAGLTEAGSRTAANLERWEKSEQEKENAAD